MKTRASSHISLQTFTELSFAALLGGVSYYLIELCWRGYSHWSMALCGALCFSCLYRLNACFQRRSVIWRALLGACIITAVELIAGLLLNIGLGMRIWDYSALPLQFLGQICLPYSFGWFLLCFPISLLSRLIRRWVFLYDE